jgi:hypothetical protein
MKKIYVVLFMSIMALALMTSVLSCKKDEDSSPASVVGFWKGTLNGTFSGNLDLLFRTDGTLRGYQASSDTNTAITLEGAYTITGKNVLITISIASIAVTVNDQNTTMNGTLTQSGATSTYTATKQ